MKKYAKILLTLLAITLVLAGCGEKKNYEIALEHHSNGNDAKAAHYFAKADGYENSAAFLTEYVKTQKNILGDTTDYLALVNGKLTGTGTFADNIEYEEDFAALAEREDIVSISGGYTLMALCADGKVVTAGFDAYDAEYKDEIESWENIKSIYYDGYINIGIQENGAVCFTGSNADRLSGLSSWTDIEKIVGDSSTYLAGLQTDGKIVMISDSALTLDDFEGWYDVSDVADIEMTESHSLVMLKKDGTIRLLNGLYSGYSGTSGGDDTMQDVSMWKNIKDIAVCGDYIHGVTQDGKLVSTNYDTQKSAEKLENIISVENNSVNNGDVIAIDQKGSVYHVQSDGKTIELKDIRLFINENY